MSQLDGPAGVADAVGVGAFLPDRQGIPQILLPRFGQLLLA